MTKNLFMLYFRPSVLGAPASDDRSAYEKKEDMLFFHSISDSLITIMVTSQKHYNITRTIYTTQNSFFTFIIEYVATNSCSLKHNIRFNKPFWISRVHPLPQTRGRELRKMIDGIVLVKH